MPALGEPVPGWSPRPRPGPPVLPGRRVRLERLDPAAHADELFAAFAGADDVWTWMPYGPFADARAYRDWAEGMAGRDDPFFYAIREADTGRALGVASFLRIDPANGVIEVGHIALSPALQRTRAATEAMALMMGWAFGAGYRRYEWKCDSLNAPSRRAAARLGFRHEGTFRQAAVVKGRNRDTAWFAVIDRDWPVLREAFAVWLDDGNFDAEGRQRRRLSAMTAAVAGAAEGARGA